MLALNVAHYQIRHRNIPLEETLTMVDGAEPNDEQPKLLVLGMENLVGVLGNVISGLEETRH